MSERDVTIRAEELDWLLNIADAAREMFKVHPELRTRSLITEELYIGVEVLYFNELIAIEGDTNATH